MKKSIALSLFLIVCGLLAHVFAVETTDLRKTDALFDMARRTDSLQDAYKPRLALPSAFEEFDLHAGADLMEFQDYPVLTDYGATDYSIVIDYSYFRFALPPNDPKKLPIFRLRGFDWSGKSVALGKAFTVDGVGFSELQGTVSMSDMFLGLFSAGIFDFDLGYIRNREFLDYLETGITSAQDFKAIQVYCLPRDNDKYSVFFSIGSGKLFDCMLRVDQKVESLRPSVSIPTVLALFGKNNLPSYVEKADVWGDYTAERLLLGAGFQVGRFVTEEIRVSNDPSNTNTEPMTSGARLSSNAEFNPIAPKLDNARVESELEFRNFFLHAAGSYVDDPLLIAFGSETGRVFGYRARFGYFWRQTLSASVSVSDNFIDYLSFMTGSYDHTIFVFAIACRL